MLLSNSSAVTLAPLERRAETSPSPVSLLSPGRSAPAEPDSRTHATRPPERATRASRRSRIAFAPVTSGGNRRLAVLLLGVAALAIMVLAKRPADRTVQALPKAASSRQALRQAALPVLQRIQLPVDQAQGPSASIRNPFKFTDVPEVPIVEPPPPPPPPEIRPAHQFLGTIDHGQLFALFGSKGEILTLQEGDRLEQKYVVKRIEPETVVLEDPEFQTTATFSVPHK